MQNHSGEQIKIDPDKYMNLLKQRKVTHEEKHQGKKIEHSFQELGIEMQQYFGKNVWYLFYKYPEDDIKYAYEICKRKNVKSIPFLIGCIKHRYSGF